ncbi:hypothetical protein BDW75DRAFT_237910 [Aspergillus navahoensis]
MEERLQANWAEMLDLPLSKVSMSQGFFALIGDSVLAIKLLARCQEYGIVTQLRDIFQRASILELAVYSTTAENPTSSATELAHTVLEVDAPGAEDVYLSTPTQQSILAAQEQVKSLYIRLREVNGYMIDECAIFVYVDSDDEISISFSYWMSVLSPEQVQDLSRAIVDTLELLSDADPTVSPLCLMGV